MWGSWHDRYVLVLLAIAAACVVLAVVVVASGRGGELVLFAPGGPGPELPADRTPDADDVFGVRLPRRVWGYQMDHVDTVLNRVAHALAERDARLAVLEQRIADLHARERERIRATRTATHDAVHNAEETW